MGQGIKTKQPTYRLLMNTKATLTILFGVSVAVANVTAAKLSWFVLPLIGGVAVPAGFVAYSNSYLCTDLLGEFEGKDYAHDVVNGTVVALVAAYALIWVSIQLPVAPFYGQEAAFNAVLGSGARIIVASIVALLISQHADVVVFNGIKRLTGVRHKWARNCISTTVSQGIDTPVFIIIGFAGTMPLNALLMTMLGQYLVKLVLMVFDTPVFYAVTAARERGWIGSEGVV